MKNLDWNDVKLFLAVARTLNVGEAAGLLGINRTTVTRRMAALERTFTEPLFDRGGRGLRLTATGRAMMITAEMIEGELAVLTEGVAGSDHDVVGPVRVTTMPALARVLAPEFSAFLARHPGTRIEVSATNSLEGLQLLESDVALMLTSSPPDDLVGRLVASPQMAVYASRDTVETLRAGAQATCAEVTGASAAREIEDILGIAVTPVFSASSIEVVTRMLGEHRGMVAMVPCYCAEGVPGLVRVSTTRSARSGLWLLYHPKHRGTKRITTFVRFMHEQLQRKRDVFEAQPDEGVSVG